jgi:hypothetical protein
VTGLLAGLADHLIDEWCQGALAELKQGARRFLRDEWGIIIPDPAAARALEEKVARVRVLLATRAAQAPGEPVAPASLRLRPAPAERAQRVRAFLATRPDMEGAGR